jgi:hypothetical protein
LLVAPLVLVALILERFNQRGSGDANERSVGVGKAEDRDDQEGNRLPQGAFELMQGRD